MPSTSTPAVTISAAVTSIASRKRTDRTEAARRRGGDRARGALREAIPTPDGLDGLPGARLGELAAKVADRDPDRVRERVGAVVPHVLEQALRVRTSLGWSMK